jgi:hypothetical protein
MLHHDERAANVLARGPAKPDDIENARRGTLEARATEEAGAERANGELEAAYQTIRDDVGELERIVRAERS